MSLVFPSPLEGTNLMVVVGGSLTVKEVDSNYKTIIAPLSLFLSSSLYKEKWSVEVSTPQRTNRYLTWLGGRIKVGWRRLLPYSCYFFTYLLFLCLPHCVPLETGNVTWLWNKMKDWTEYSQSKWKIFPWSSSGI